MLYYFSPYSLTYKNSDLKQEGCLIKIEEAAGVWGVADICPRLDLGDAPYIIELKNKSHLFKRSVELAFEDLLARKNKESLLLDKPVANNYLLTNFLNEDLDQKKYINKTLKIKGSQNIELLAQKINEIKINREVKIRIDFNAKLKSDEFEKFLTRLTPDALLLIDYIEDPTEFNSNWLQWNKRVNLAHDFQAAPYNENFAKYKIVKPVREKVDLKMKHFTLTSAMDHPVGLAHGLRFAQKLAQNDSGFLTLDLYEQTVFNKYYSQLENYLNFSFLALNDFGIGMTEEINKLTWQSMDRMSF